MLDIYDELRALAAYQLRRERPDHTLQPTALVHEVWLRLRSCEVEWQDRRHYVNVAARAMRQVLVEHARKRSSEKGPESHRRVLLHDALQLADGEAIEVLALHEALEHLEQKQARAARLVELRFFAGLTAREAAEALDVSLRTVHGDWRMAKAWLLRELEPDESS